MRVLLVDDSPDSNWVLSHLLRTKAGFEVRSVEDATLAVSVATEFRPDAICLDISMPSIDGYSLAVAMRQVSGLEEVAIVVASGCLPNAVRSNEAGIDDYLLKPIDSRALGVAILKAVSRRDPSRQVELAGVSLTS